MAIEEVVRKVLVDAHADVSRLRGPVSSESLRSVLEQQQSGVPEQTPTPN
jgi:hypothetical protein